MIKEESYFRIAKIAGAHGLHGLLKILIITDIPERFTRDNIVFIEDASDFKKHRIIEFHVHKGKIGILGLDDISNRDEASALKGRNIFITGTEADKTRKLLEAGSYYYQDIIDCDVFNGKKAFGKVVNILEAGGGEILVIRFEGRDYLVPFVGSMVDTSDILNHRIVINPVDGLFDLEIS